MSKTKITKENVFNIDVALENLSICFLTCANVCALAILFFGVILK